MRHPPDVDDPGPPAIHRHTIVADRGDAGVRLDRVLRRRLAGETGASRTRVQRWITTGAVRVGGRTVLRVATRVAFGDEITVEVAVAAPRQRPKAEAFPLTVLYEDPDLIVVDKPPHLVVHPSYKHPSGTVLNALLGRGGDEGAGWTPRLVHRLDRQTSGVLLAAKHLDAYRRLVRAWPTPRVEKTYLAITTGRPARRSGEIRLRLARDPLDTRRVLVSPARGRDSLTRYQVLAASKGLRAGIALVRCELVTGRMHQLRVHLASIGCPIVGDRVYGSSRRAEVADPRLAAAIRSSPRQALHAWRLAVREDGDQQPRVFVAPLPPDLRRLLEVAGIDLDAVLSRW